MSGLKGAVSVLGWVLFGACVLGEILNKKNGGTPYQLWFVSAVVNLIAVFL